MVQYIVEYIWLGGHDEIRSKTRVVDFNGHPLDLKDWPSWNYDGSSTDQATGTSSEVFLKPVAVFGNPLRKTGLKALLLCETYDAEGRPLSNNYRPAAAAIFERFAAETPWYGFEQEYFMMEPLTGEPIGFQGQEQGQFYCGNGAANAFGRSLAEEHMETCLAAGIQVSGINAEVAPGQWEFQVGAVEGLAACDQLIMARFLLERLAEKHGVSISYHPKPLGAEYNGSGCHTNFSTKAMREEGGLVVILAAMSKLEAKHKEHIAVYGTENELRLTGKHETSSMEHFSWGIANRQASVRIGTETSRDGRGYLEDRRPAANINPYQVAPLLLETCCS
jgi:glutamine synthetase